MAGARSCLASGSIILGGLLFALATLLNVYHHPLTSPYTQVDEQAHLSYAQHLIEHQRWWPDYDHFVQYKTRDASRIDSLPNYLNHPPSFYWLAKALHWAMPEAGFAEFRMISISFLLVFIALYVAMGVRLSTGTASSIAYAMLPFLFYQQFQLGFFNNDALALVGGSLAVLASIHWFTSAVRYAWVGLCLGLLLASVKLTALILVGAYVAACLLLRMTHLCQLRLWQWLLMLVSGVAALSPYLIMTLRFGSPAPETPGQLGKLLLSMEHNPAAHAPRESMLQWLGEFLLRFADQLPSRLETTFIPLLCLAALFLVVMLYPHARRQYRRTALGSVLLATSIASLITLIIHAAFSWQRYLEYGWVYDSHIRYYMPLMAAYGLGFCAVIRYVAGIGKKKESHDTP
jgi:hypothetical protein